jgi:hypothetical protein
MLILQSIKTRSVNNVDEDANISIYEDIRAVLPGQWSRLPAKSPSYTGHTT